MDENICVRSKMYAFKCGDDSENKVKGVCISQSKKFRIEEFEKCLGGKDCPKECDKNLMRSINNEMYLQRVLKCTLSSFDDNRFHAINIECKPWKWNL